MTVRLSDSEKCAIVGVFHAVCTNNSYLNEIFRRWALSNNAHLINTEGYADNDGFYIFLTSKLEEALVEGKYVFIVHVEHSPAIKLKTLADIFESVGRAVSFREDWQNRVKVLILQATEDYGDVA